MTSGKVCNTLVRITTVPLSLEKLLENQMQFMGEHGFQVYMVSSAGKNINLLEQRECARFIAVNMTRTISPFKDIVSLIRLVIVLGKLKPDIVHTHTPKAGLLGMIASWLTRVPVRLHTVAGLPLMETTGLKRKVLELVEKLTYCCAVMVYPNSKNLQRFILESKFCKSSKLKVIGNGSSNGIDTTLFKTTRGLLDEAGELKKKYGIGENDFIYIFVGRLVRDKGIEELVAAFSEINSKYDNVWLLLIGTIEHELDPLSTVCSKEIEKNPRIIAAGYKDDVKPYMVMSNILVFPSYREGFPNVPMQAGCFNLPSIVTNINGCNEIIEHNKNGLIVPVKDATALTDAMLLVLTNENLYGILKNNARNMIVERYEQRVVWNLILSEYQTHLKAKKIVS